MIKFIYLTALSACVYLNILASGIADEERYRLRRLAMKAYMKTNGSDMFWLERKDP